MKFLPLPETYTYLHHLRLPITTSDGTNYEAVPFLKWLAWDWEGNYNMDITSPIICFKCIDDHRLIRRLDYLIKIGNQEEAENHRNADPELVQALDQGVENRSFYQWKSKVSQTTFYSLLTTTSHLWECKAMLTHTAILCLHSCPLCWSRRWKV